MFADVIPRATHNAALSFHESTHAMPKEKTQKTTPPASQLVVCIGIDWADQLHAYHLTDLNGKPVAGTVQQQPGQIKELFEIWRQQFPAALFCVAIEQSKGPLIHILLDFSDVMIYPINPAALASYRKAFAHGGGKNDPSDAQLLCQYLENYRDQLRPLRTDDPLTKELTSLAEDRRRLVDQRAGLSNELRAMLKLYFPVILELKAAKLYADFLIRFLRKYPTLSGEAGTQHLVSDRGRLLNLGSSVMDVQPSAAAAFTRAQRGIGAGRSSGGVCCKLVGLIGGGLRLAEGREKGALALT